MTDEELAGRIEQQLSKAGVELAIPTDALKTRSTIAGYVTWGPTNPGSVTVLDIRFAPPPPPRKTCGPVELLDLAGYGRTGADGSVRLHVPDFLCRDLTIEQEDEVWVVATPRSSQPVYLTHLVVRPPTHPGPPGPAPPPSPIQVRIFAWDSAGQPKAGVSFTWRVLLHYVAGVE
jgi:hypothetical protein